MQRFRAFFVEWASLPGAALLIAALGVTPAAAQSPPPDEIAEFRATRVDSLTADIATREYKHKECPPSADPSAMANCTAPAMGNPDTALRGEGAFMASIGPPADYVEPGVGQISEDNWKDRHYCGGTLIAPGWVLSAAHCISQEKVAAGFRVRLGMSNLALPEGRHYPIDRIVCFKQKYCRDDRPKVLYRDDIALIHFKADPADFVAAPDPEYFHRRGVALAEFSADEGVVTTWSEDGTKRQWDAANGAELVRETFPVSDYEFARGGFARSSSFPEGNIRLGAGTKLVSPGTGRALSWDYHFDEASGRSQTIFSFADPSASDVRRELKLDRVSNISFAPGEAYLAMLDGDKNGAGLQATALEIDGSRVRWIHDVQYKKPPPVDGLIFEDFAYSVEPSILGLTDKTVLIGSDDAADLLDAETGRLLGRLQHPRDTAWNGRGGSETDLGTRNLVTAGTVVADQARVLTVTQRYAASDIWLWDMASGQLVQRFAQQDPLISEYAQDAKLIAGGAQVLSWSQYGTLHLWDVATARSLAVMDQRLPVKDVMLARQDRLAVVRDAAGLSVWDLAAGKQLARMDHLNWVEGAVLSPDGTKVLSWSEDATARLWSIADGRELQRIYHNGGIRGARFSPGGQRILTWSEDGTARITGAPGGEVKMIFDIARNPSHAPLTPPVERQAERKAEIAYLPIAGSGYELDEYGRVAVYGWGKTRDEDGWEPYASLMRIQLRVLDNDECSELEGMESSRRVPRVNPDIFCGQDRRQKTCKGDSGGPVIQDGIVVGIVNWGKTTCAGTGEAGVYARVANYAGWILEQIGEDSGLTVLDAPLPYDPPATRSR